VVAALAACAATVAVRRGDAQGSPTGGSAQASRPAAAALAHLPDELPPTLAATGLYADTTRKWIAAQNRPFAPQYPLWTDGAKKRRYIYLPPGATIDATSPDAWEFPVGTKLWKEFSFGGPVETRYMERTERGWRFATYVVGDDARGAALAAPRGGVAKAEVAPGVAHQIPSQGDCRVCHSAVRPVLGFSALQLSGARDPGAPHAEVPEGGALDLPALVREGRLVGFRGTVTPSIVARSATERAALGYLHANCGGCHNAAGALASLGMALDASAVPGDSQPPGAIRTAVGVASRAAPEMLRVAAGEPAASLLLKRLRSREASLQMPPLGTRVVDDDAVKLVARWIDEL